MNKCVCVCERERERAINKSVCVSTVNILAKFAHFFHSSKFWVSLIFPGFSRCFLAPLIGYKRYSCQKSYKIVRNAKILRFSYFKLVETYLETSEKCLKIHIFGYFFDPCGAYFLQVFRFLGKSLFIPPPHQGGRILPEYLPLLKRQIWSAWLGQQNPRGDYFMKAYLLHFGD